MVRYDIVRRRQSHTSSDCDAKMIDDKPPYDSCVLLVFKTVRTISSSVGRIMSTMASRISNLTGGHLFKQSV